MGPSYFVKAFAPPKPQTIKKLDVSANKFNIEYCYCITLERIAGGRVRAKDMIFLDRLHGETISPLVCLQIKADEGWRLALFIQRFQPEKNRLNTEILRLWMG